MINKVNLLKKFINSNSMQKAEEADKINFIKSMQQNELDWERRDKQNNERKARQIQRLQSELNLQLNEK